jgi:heme o synthase
VIPSLKAFTSLIKLRVGLAVVLSAAVGYLVQNHQSDILLVITSLGVLMLASGSAALNHWQEHRRDGMMERTAHRPIPSGTYSRNTALVIAGVLILSGTTILMAFAGIIPAVLGVATLVWYNFVYTPLKVKTSYALLIGALVGAFPPAIGFTAAGGDILDPMLLIICLFYFVWQVPHFFLLLLKYGDDYLKAGFKPLNRTVPHKSLARLTFLWIVALVFCALLFPLFGLIHRDLYLGVLVASGLGLILGSLPLVRHASVDPHIPRMFRIINLFMLLVSHLLMFENIF